MRSLEIGTSWDGLPALAEERVRLELIESDDLWKVRFDAPFHGDRMPEAPPGRCERLWEFEVVELFLVGPEGRYLELEFGPGGHYLGLKLHGIRRIVDAEVRVDYAPSLSGDRWRGAAEIPSEVIPQPVLRWNAFAIHGEGERRRHLVAAPLVAGARPDFHRIDEFPEY